MGGAVKAVTKPVADVVAVVSGGKTSGQRQAEAQTKAMQAQSAQAAQAQEAAKPVERRASAADEMMGARMRGARRRGRQLLSDARLNAESGVQTLGGGNNLGQ
jgi:hypothetical protein